MIILLFLYIEAEGLKDMIFDQYFTINIQIVYVVNVVKLFSKYTLENEGYCNY
jgi:hypothetical protein